MRQLYIFLFLIIMSFTACETGVEGPPELGKEYHPVELGQYRVYDVSKEIITNTSRDTSRYTLVEVIKDTIITNQETKYLLYRYYKYEGQSDFSLDSVWSMFATDQKITRIENNQTYFPFTFPVRDDILWDGNAANPGDYDPYTFLEKGVAYGNYSETVKLRKGSYSQNKVETDFRQDIYARDIGLVYSYKKVLAHQPDMNDTSGIVQIQTLTAFGSDSL